jgi:hypothetical protein
LLRKEKLVNFNQQLYVGNIPLTAPGHCTHTIQPPARQRNYGGKYRLKERLHVGIYFFSQELHCFFWKLPFSTLGFFQIFNDEKGEQDGIKWK